MLSLKNKYHGRLQQIGRKRIRLERLTILNFLLAQEDLAALYVADMQAEGS